MSEIVIGKTIDDVANRLFVLITKYGETTRIVDVIAKEQNDGTE